MSTLLSTYQSALLDAASKATVNAYKPYSDYPVGAAVLLSDGSIISGVNIENASYPNGICAERVALGNAISQGRQDVVAIAVHSPKGDISPCGMCRQFIAEFGADTLLLFHWQGQLRTMAISELLPFSFNHSHVNGDDDTQH